MELGHLAGLCVATQDAKLTYAALQLPKTDEKLQSIPLSALIEKARQNEWMLDISKISEETLAAQPEFSRSEWVDSVDIGWSEYVDLLYGRPVFEGVRSE